MRMNLTLLAAFLVPIAACATGDDETAASASPPATVSASPTPGPALNDPTIVAIFDAANAADIETGQLAVERGSTKEVRDFGAMLARDHRNVQQQGRDLAQRLGVTPTPPVDDASAKAHADAMAMLRTKSGADFDRAFLDHEVKFHQAVIDAVNQTLLPAIQNQELRSLVVAVAPAFDAHRIAAANMRAKLGN